MSRTLRSPEPKTPTVPALDVAPEPVPRALESSVERILLRTALYIALVAALVQVFANDDETRRTPVVAAVVCLAGLACSAKR